MVSKQNNAYYYNVASDYISGAHSYMLAAKIITENLNNMRLDDPISFLLGHSSELVLKAGLALNGYDVKELSDFGHDLKELMALNISRNVVVSTDLKMWVEMIADNYLEHDYKYSRVFAGFPNEKHAYLSNLISKRRSSKEEKILKEHGLMVKSLLHDYHPFIKSLEEHIDLVWEVLEEKKKAS